LPALYGEDIKILIKMRNDLVIHTGKIWRYMERGRQRDGRERNSFQMRIFELLKINSRKTDIFLLLPLSASKENVN